MVYNWVQTGEWFVTVCKGGNSLQLGANREMVFTGCKGGNGLQLGANREMVCSWV